MGQGLLLGPLKITLECIPEHRRRKNTQYTLILANT